MHGTETHPRTLDAGQHAALAAFRDLLLRWNARFNLTAITDPNEVDRRLIGDALAMLPALDEAVATLPAPPARPRLIDVGSGAGFPALVLAIARPELEVTSLDATGKKVAFQQAAIDELGLANAHALHGRAEELGQDPAHRERYDIVTARAVSALPVLMELCLPLLRVGGRGIFPKGTEIAAELEEGERAAELVGGRLVATEDVRPIGASSVTRLVFCVKVAPSPPRYPRRSGTPAKEPLGRVHR